MVDYKVYPLEIALELFSEEEIHNAFRKFSCSVDSDLESFLVNKAENYELHWKGRTFLLLDQREFEENNTIRIIAYFTLAHTAIELSGFGDGKKKKIVGDFPKRSQRNSFPAFLIGQLGRDDSYSHDDISGEQILQEAYQSLKRAADILGGKLVVLECREHMFDKVYEKLGFKKLVNELNEDNLYTLYKRIEF